MLRVLSLTCVLFFTSSLESYALEQEIQSSHTSYVSEVDGACLHALSQQEKAIQSELLTTQNRLKQVQTSLKESAISFQKNLCDAIDNDDMEAFKKLLGQTKNIHIEASHHNPFLRAIRRGNSEAIVLLREHYNLNVNYIEHIVTDTGPDQTKMLTINEQTTPENPFIIIPLVEAMRLPSDKMISVIQTLLSFEDINVNPVKLPGLATKFRIISPFEHALRRRNKEVIHLFLERDDLILTHMSKGYPNTPAGYFYLALEEQVDDHKTINLFLNHNEMNQLAVINALNRLPRRKRKVMDKNILELLYNYVDESQFKRMLRKTFSLKKLPKKPTETKI